MHTKGVMFFCALKRLKYRAKKHSRNTSRAVPEQSCSLQYMADTCLAPRLFASWGWTKAIHHVNELRGVRRVFTRIPPSAATSQRAVSFVVYMSRVKKEPRRKKAQGFPITALL